MKKMSILTALIMLVTITTYSVSGTYAKYTSQIDLTDEARVAKWAFSAEHDGTAITNNKIDLFGSSYKWNGLTYVEALANEDGTRDNVVAPGTKGSYDFDLVGDMEVRYQLTFDIDASKDFVVYYSTTELDENGKMKKSTTSFDGASEYRPLRYSVEYKRDGKLVNTIPATTADQLAGLLNTYNTTHPTGFAPGKMDQSYTLNWSWDDITQGTGLTDAQVNELDTFAGENLSANKVEFGVTVTATQVAENHSEVSAN